MHPKLLLLASLLMVFSACNQSPAHSSEANATKEHLHQHDEEIEHYDVANLKELALNNGAKWQTDQSTNKHAAALNVIADSFEKNSNINLDSYHEFADTVQKELQQLINDCSMKGPEHDALHLWLEPLLTDVKNLKNCDNPEEAKIASASLIKDVRKYNQFFN